jgi:phosphate transport system permease protein
MVSDDSSSHGLAALGLPADGATSAGDRQGRDQDRGRVPAKRSLRSRRNPSDLIFRAIARGGGSVVLIIMILVGTFLGFRAWQALHKAGWSFLTTQAWNPDGGGFGIAAIMVGTVLIAAIAIVVAIPLSLGTALYISEYAPRRLQRPLISLIDLMAAVPSVIFGLWGFFLLQWWLSPVARWLSDWFYWIPAFRVSGVPRETPTPSLITYTGSSLAAGLVVGLMITPIIASVMREAFSQAPVGEREGAYALGATRWGMIRAVVLPFAKGAMIGSTMLGLGRALGETMAVTMIISVVFAIQPHVLEHGTSSISSLIALHWGESTPFATSALMAAGLALFAMTLLVNVIAAQIVARSRSGAQSEA